MRTLQRRNILLAVFIMLAVGLAVKAVAESGETTLAINPAFVVTIATPTYTETVDLADLRIYVEAVNSQSVRVHRITAPWTEHGVTWNNFGNNFAPGIEASFVSNSTGFHQTDVTGLVQAWVNGVANFGLLLEEDLDSSHSYRSSEYSSVQHRPYLRVCYRTAIPTGTPTPTSAQMASSTPELTPASTPTPASTSTPTGTQANYGGAVFRCPTTNTTFLPSVASTNWPPGYAGVGYVSPDSADDHPITPLNTKPSGFTRGLSFYAAENSTPATAHFASG